MTEDVPSKIGRYVIDRLAGAGAMGYVYVGRDPELDRAVAIKTLRDLGMDPASLATFLERFKNEARAAARLHHPSIVQVYDVGEDESVGPYLVFEYVPGRSLKEVIREEGAMAATDLVNLAEQIAEALETAHAQEIVHRDVKPDNLLTTDDGRVKLADFGIARIPNAALTREGQFLGTPCYAAPETLMEGSYGPKTDIFSFAAVLYEVATGVRAFPGDDAVAVANKVVHQEPPAPVDVATGPDIPDSVSAIIVRGLSKDPKKRYGSARALAADLRKAYEDAGEVIEERESTGAVRISPRPVPTPTAGDRGERSNVAFFAIVGGGLAVGVALVFALSAADPIESFDAGIGADDAGTSSPSDMGRRTSRRDAAIVTLGADDAGPDVAVDTGTADEVAGMSLFEREERAKDLIDEARRHIDGRRFDEARVALDEARRYDPENDEIREVRALIP
jgi:serine/threonine-protein kinase